MAQTLDQFVSAWTNKYADYDGWYGAQCVDLANFYERDVIGGPFVPGDGAKDWITNYPKDKFSYTPNNMSDPNQLPSRGDIMIWNGTLPGSHGYGHIAIVLAADKSGFTSFDQNFPSGSLPHQQYHKWDSTVAGWLHPTANGAAPSTPAPTPPQAATVQHVVVLGDYRTLYRGPGTGAFQRIAPNQFPQFGNKLDYVVLDRSGDFVKIHTSMYGDAWIFVGASVSNLTQFYNA